jgi:hypothetical protein
LFFGVPCNPALEICVYRHYLQREPTTPSWRFFDKTGFVWRAEMSLLFYLTLFIVMCVFGWSTRGAG